jgi:predicted small lipoprotein YifL
MKKINHFIRLAGCSLCLVILLGCGQTGDLYIPQEVNNLIEKYEYRE